MKLDLTKAHKIEPHVVCWEDSERVSFDTCMRCACFFPIVAGSMMCMSGLAGFKKGLSEAYKYECQLED